MANELIIYTTPAGATVTFKPDNGSMVTGIPGTYNGRSDGHLITLPADLLAGQGSVLTVTMEQYVTFSNRGLLVPSSTGPAQFFLDDVHLVAAAIAPEPGPTPPPGPGPEVTDPLARIQAIYATGAYSLVSKEGCGLFTEAVATDFAFFWGLQKWGHVLKHPGQNQYNTHAVDAIHCLYGNDGGIWDIITSSASTSAKPAYNRAGDQKPEIWRPYTPLPCVP